MNEPLIHCLFSNFSSTATAYVREFKKNLNLISGATKRQKITLF